MTTSDDPETQSGNDERLGWSWEEIEGDWLQGAQLAADRETVVEAFNRVEARFGRDWIEATRLQPGAIGPVRGTVPTLDIAVLGEQLAVLDRATGCDRLLEKLRNRELSASAELMAIHRAAGGTPDVRVGCEPKVTVGDRERRPDFRLAKGEEPWVYVEVTRPNPADAQRQLRDAMNELAGLLDTITGNYTAEVFFHRHAQVHEVGSAARIGVISVGLPSVGLAGKDVHHAEALSEGVP